MKKIFRTVSALALITFTGCVNNLESDVNTPSGAQTTVTVGLAETKTSLGELVDGKRSVYWSDGDEIVINGSKSTSAEISESRTYATFKFEGVELDYPYSVLYPAVMYKNEMTITLPAQQAAASGTFATDSSPMAAYQASEGNVSLHHLASVVRLQVKLPAESTHASHFLSKVEFRGNADEQVSGDFSIDYETSTLTSASSAEADKKVTAKVNQYLSSEEAVDVFVVVPACEYANGFTVRLIDAGGHYMDLKSGTLTLEKGDIKAMPVVDFAPTGTLVGVEIASASDLVAFAAAYNAGSYADQDPLVVKLTEDIVFDDETNAQWQPIADETDGNIQYFYGYFDGDGHSIKNWTSSRPLFGYTGTGSTITNLTVDASCTLTADFTDEDPYFGPVVGAHKGNLINCHNNAAITVTGTWTNELYVGGLAGRIRNGKVDGCTNSGNITLTSEVALADLSYYVGGIAGRISNTDGMVSESENNGEISISAIQTTSEGMSSATSYVGGVVGFNAGIVDGCVNNMSITVNAETESASQYVGGVVGYLSGDAVIQSILNSTNNGAIYFNARAGLTADDAKGRYAYLGGVVGAGHGVIKGNTNNANITSTSSLKFHYIGGVVGLLDSGYACEIKDNTNAETVVLNSTGAPRTLAMGGLLGYNNNSSDLKLDFTGDKGHIKGQIKTNNIESNNTSATMGLGGYVGATLQKLTVVGAKEGADVELDQSVSINSKIIGVGGALGYAFATTGSLTIDGVETNNKINVIVDNTKGIGALLLSIGGVVGVVDYNGTDDIVTNIQNTTSNCPITWNNNAGRWNGRCCTVGGIVGCIKGGKATISGCHNKVRVDNRLYNDSASIDVVNCAGGILGRYNQETTGGTLTITDCTNSGEVANMRGCSGGIAALVRDAHISECTVTGQITAGGALQYFGAGTQGGVSAYAKNTVFTSCVAKTDMTIALRGEILLRAGGICAVLQEQSVIDRCSYFGALSEYGLGTTEAYYGGLAGLAESTATIKDSKFGGTLRDSANLITVTAENYNSYSANYVVNGTTANAPTIQNCQYWDGN